MSLFLDRRLWVTACSVARGAAAALVTLATIGNAQQFVTTPAGIPDDEAARTEGLAVGDVDLDGDMDVLLGNGSQSLAYFNRLWINQGGLQGGTLGLFFSEGERLPSGSNDPTMAVDLVDIDGDGDLDAFCTNNSLQTFSPHQWWVNVGGKQRGTLGYFVDETADRWVGLGEPGSTVPPSIVAASGGFVSTSWESDFGDLDLDGDLDLVLSGYFGYPIRMFLNDSNGYFSDFNPSGLMGPSIPEGWVAFWCEGIQDSHTTDTTGQFADIEPECRDLDLIDIDGDLDLDVYASDNGPSPRVYVNRTRGSALAPATPDGSLAFRDVTAAALPVVSSLADQPTQEFGDFDGDGDLDIYAANHGDGVAPGHDALFENLGAGTFAPPVKVADIFFAGPTAVFDFDANGLLDVYVPVAGGDRIYRGNGDLTLTPQVWTGDTANSWPESTRAFDADLDGDYDILTGRTSFNRYEVNASQVHDASAPWFPLIDALGSAQASSEPRCLPLHVLDNAPLYINRFNDTEVHVSVDGVHVLDLDTDWAGGQLFRAEIPGNLYGVVEYFLTSRDAYGNEGTSTALSYASSAPAFQSEFGSGAEGLTGGIPHLRALSLPMSGQRFLLALSSGAPPESLALFVAATAPLVPGIPVPGVLHLNVGGEFLLTQFGELDASGDAVLDLKIGSVPVGLTFYAQGFVADPTAGGEALASSRGLQLTTQ